MAGRSKKKADTIFLVCEETRDINYTLKRKPRRRETSFEEGTARVCGNTPGTSKRKSSSTPNRFGKMNQSSLMRLFANLEAIGPTVNINHVIDSHGVVFSFRIGNMPNREARMQRQWRIVPHDAPRVENLIRSANLPPVVAQLMVSRGVYTANEAASFLDTKLTGLRDPQELPGVPAATELLVDAIKEKTPVVIYGDYDCDGMTGSAILVNGLRLLGGDVSYHVPNRLEEGYGLNADAIRKLAERGKKLIVSVDCGITSIECAKLCKELGVKLIITDHHTMLDELPDADAIVHPQLPGKAYPFTGLCGAGVAFKLAWSLCQTICGSKKVTDPMRKYLMQSLSLCAIGTVADVVPLVDENRILGNPWLANTAQRTAARLGRIDENHQAA